MTEKKIDELLKSSLSNETDASINLKNEVLRKMKANENKGKIKFTRIIRNTAAAAACFVLCIGVAANVSQTAFNAMNKLPILNTITNAITFRTYEDNSGKSNASIEKPHVENLGNATEAVNKQIDDYIDGIIAEYQENRDISLGEAIGETDKFDITTGFAVMSENDNYFSLRIWTNLVMAGAQEYNKYFVVDKKNECIIQLDDLFTNEQMQKIQQMLVSTMTSIEENGGAVYYTESLVIDENTKFYIDRDNRIILSFDKYEVAAGAYGIQEFIVGTIKDGKAKLRENNAYRIEKISGVVIEAGADSLVIEDYNGQKHEVFKGNAVIINHGDRLELGDNITICYTGVTKNVIMAEVVEIF